MRTVSESLTTTVSGVAILQMGKGDTGDSGAAAFLTHQGQSLVSITFNSDVVTTNTVNALFTVLHELVHASLVKKYPFMQHKCDPGAGEACTDACTDPEAGFANAMSSGQNADCFDCQFCSEQHADCAAALLACCLAADCFASSLTEGEKEKLRGVANVGQAKCQDTKAKRPGACSNCAAEIGDPAAVPPTLPEKPADSGCYPDDPETGEDDEGHEALCDKCNELASELEPQP